MRFVFNVERDVASSKLNEIKMLRSSKHIIVLIHAEYCGHCKVLRPEWNRFCQEHAHNDQLVFIEVESQVVGVLRRVDPELSSQILAKIEGYPSIMLYVPPKAYTAYPRTFASLNEFTEKHVEGLARPKSAPSRPASAQSKSKSAPPAFTVKKIKTRPASAPSKSKATPKVSKSARPKSA